MSKLFFWTTLIIGAIRDFSPDVPNLENYAFIATGLLCSFVAHLIFEDSGE